MGNAAPSGDALAHLDEIGKKVIAAAREEFVRFGIRRANVEEIARRAGVARVTVYRRFESKTALFQAVVLADIVDFLGRFDAVFLGDDPVRDRIADAFVLAVREVRRHPLLNTIIHADTEILASALTLEGETQFEMIKGLLADRIAQLVAREDVAGVDPSRTSELAIRLMYTVILMPFGDLPGRTDDDVHAFATEYLVPLLAPAAR